MVHGDDQGLRLPPAVAPTQVVIVPIWRKPEEGEQVLTPRARCLLTLENAGIRAQLDEREGVTPGFKFNDWEMRGVPVRVEIGPRDVASGEVVIARRDIAGTAGKNKAPIAEVAARATVLLDEIQKNCWSRRAPRRRQYPSRSTTTTVRRTDGGRGRRRFRRDLLVRESSCETKIREETRATCRAIPLNQSHPPGNCVVCGEVAAERALFAKAY